jgi:SAM-dependent methyltransferase
MKKTDWDDYYSHPYVTARVTRKIMASRLTGLMKKSLGESKGKIKIAELGGANSCFYETINGNFNPEKYLIVDNNRIGLDKTLERFKTSNIFIKQEDILASSESNEKFDVVFSVGLIEHFNKEDTGKCIAAHFKYLKNNGICIITFPTPTWLYKLTRKLSEMAGMWIFHDERPLLPEEVLDEIEKHGKVMHNRIIWPVFLTQGIIMATKFGSK